MKETEWLACGDPKQLLNVLRRRSKGDNGGVMVRRLALFAIACARRIWHLIPHGVSQDAVTVAESAVEGLASAEDLRSACNKAHAAWDLIRLKLLTRGVRHKKAMEAESGGRYVAWYSAECGAGSKTNAFSRASNVVVSAAAEADGGETLDDWAKSFLAECDLLRDIFGNPFRPVTLDPPSRTSTVTALAQGAYDDRILPAGTLDSDRLAVLADALEDACCTEAAILEHLRRPGPHVRGCWCVDLILCKT